MAWRALDTNEALQHLMDRFGWFHDACLRDASLVTRTHTEPNSWAHRHVDPDTEPPAVEIVAASMAWRPVADALGPVVRHRRLDE